MKKLICLLLAAAFFPLAGMTQTHKSIKSYIRFFSDAPMEDIEAINTEGSSLFNIETGEIAFSIPIRGFQFEKSLMQEHFNENYLESDQYPHATFQGKVTEYDKRATGTQKAKAVGTMTIHGVSKTVEIEGEFNLSDNYLKMKAKFPIRVADYEIEIPTVVFYNIAEVVDVTVIFDYAKI